MLRGVEEPSDAGGGLRLHDYFAPFGLIVRKSHHTVTARGANRLQPRGGLAAYMRQHGHLRRGRTGGQLQGGFHTVQESGQVSALQILITQRLVT